MIWMLATTSSKAVTQEFQFIDLSVTSTEQKRRNRTIARSHAMKVVRGVQRRLNNTTSQNALQLNSPLIPEEEEFETIWCDAPSRTAKCQDVRSSHEAIVPHGPNRTSLSPIHRLMVEHDNNPLRVYSGKPTPALHACIDYCKSDPRFGTFYPIRNLVLIQI
jgi:hypothetical protein